MKRDIIEYQKKPKTKITILIDSEALEWFRGFPKYQLLINKVLENYHDLRKGRKN